MSFPVRFGKYLLLERVNVGGMAEVFKARPIGVAGFDRILAIKRILPNLIEDEEFVRMFIDEARIATQLKHDNIVQIYELGKQGEHYYIAMEYIASRDLRGLLDRLRAAGQLMPIAQAAYLTAKVAEGLDYAHRRRDPQGNPMHIIHRDVSPQNILVGFDGEVKVIDFGIAKAANRASKTQAGVLTGKFGYMSPEQVRGLPIDRRSDVFAVGVLLYEMLTGERLFIGESDFSTLERVRNAEVIPPSSFNKKITPQLERIVLKTLAREVEDRYQWGSELARDLQSFASDASGAFNARRVSMAMRELYSSEVALERRKLEEFMQIQPESVVRGSAQQGSILPLPQRQSTRPTQPVLAGAMRQGQVVSDEDAGAEEFGEDKTFVIEASAAGKALANGTLDHSDRSQPDVSLYGSAEEPDNDVRTLAGQLRQPPAGRPAAPPVAGPRGFDPVAAAMADEDADALMAISGAAIETNRPSVPFGVEPAIASMPTAPKPMQALTPGFAPPITQAVTAPPGGFRPPGLSESHALAPVDSDAPVSVSTKVSWAPAAVAAACSALMLVGSVAFLVSRLAGEGTPAELVLMSVGTAPAGLVVSLDGVEIGRALPVKVPLAEGEHRLEVVGAGRTLVSRVVRGTGGTVTQPVYFSEAATPSSTTAPLPVPGGWRLQLAAIAEDGSPVDGAEVFANGRSLGLTPLEAELDPSLQTVALLVRKEGFAARDVSLSRQGRQVVGPATVALVRGATPPAPPPSAPPPPEERRPTPSSTMPPTGPASTSPTSGTTSGAAAATTGPPASTGSVQPPAPKPEPPRATQTAQLQIGTKPETELVIDGRSHGVGPFFGPKTLTLPMGAHRIEFFDRKNGKRYRYQLKLNAPDPNNKVVLQFDKADPAKVEGQVDLKRLD